MDDLLTFKSLVALLPFAALSLTAVFLLRSWSKHLHNVRLLQSMPGPPKTVVPLVSVLVGLYRTSKLAPDPNTAQFLMRKLNVEKYNKHGLYSVMGPSGPFIVVFRADLIEEVIKSPHFSDKSTNYDTFKLWLGNGLLISNGATWKRQRRMLTPSFHFKILDQYETTMNSHVLETIAEMREDSKLRKDVELSRWATDCTMSILLETVMGMKTSDPGTNRAYVDALNRVSNLFVKRFSRLLNMFDFYYFNSVEGKTLLKAVDHLHQFTKDVISIKIKEFSDDPSRMEVKEGEKQAFLDMLISMHLKDKSLTVEEMREQADTFMFAGHDTTGWGIAWVLYQIGLYPDVQVKLHEEMDEVFGNDRARHVTQDDLKQLKYFECVLKECQRIYPSVPSFSRKCTQDGAKIGSYTIPYGTTVALAVFFLHRDPQHFPDPEKFDPDRFLPENTRGRHIYAFLPFSAGPRNCIGQKFALQELRITLVNVIRNFSLKSRDPPNKLEVAGEIILKSKHGIYVDFEPR